MTTPNMNLTLPTVGSTVGPTWATQLNTAFTQVDAHTHVVGAGQGVPISSAALNIDAAVNWNNYSLLNASLVSLQDQGAAVLVSGALYRDGANLWFKDGNGTNIQITASGGIVGSPGSISGLSSPASATYSLGVFAWQSNALTAAAMDCGPILLRTTTVSSNAVTLTPASTTTAYTLTLPAAVPASTSFLTMSASGDLATQTQISGSSLVNNTVVNSKLAPVIVGLSSSGSSSVSSSSFSTVGNTASITTVSRGTFSTVAYTLQAPFGGSSGSIELTNTSDALVTAELRMKVLDVATSTTYYHNKQSIIAPMIGSQGRFFRFPLSSFHGVFQLAGSGQIDLTLEARIAGGSGTVSVYNFEIFAYQI